MHQTFLTTVRMRHIVEKLNVIDLVEGVLRHNLMATNHPPPAYCAVYNLTERRFVAPFENLTLLGLMMGRRGRERNGGIGDGATIQAGLFAIDSQALPPGATSREECDVGRIR